MTLPRLLVLTDRHQVPTGRTLIDHLQDCVGAGASYVILRELDLPISARSELSEAATALGATVFSARDTLPGASGVHEASSPPFRRRVPGTITGRSCHSRAQVEQAGGDGCQYATLGPFAATASKPGYGPPLAASEYPDLPIPTFALGGITPANARSAVTAGAHGVAVMGAVMRSSDPGRVVRELLEAVS